MASKLNKSAAVLLVKNLRESLDYWRDKVGFNVDAVFGDPQNFAMPHRDDVVVMLAQTPNGIDPPPANWRIVDKCNQVYIWVQEVDELYRELQQRGATIDYTLYDTPWGTREFGIQDLDDHDITFGMILNSEKSKPG